MSDTVLLVVVFGAIALGIVAFVYGGSVLRDMRERRILADGLPAQARIVALEPTGNMFNNVPEMRITLEVQPNGGAPFAAELVRVVGIADLPRFAPGQVVAIRHEAPPSTRVALVP